MTKLKGAGENCPLPPICVSSKKNAYDTWLIVRGVNYKKCEKLEESVKFGTKMHLTIKNSNRLGAMQTSVVKTNPGGLLFFIPMFLLHRKEGWFSSI